MCVQPGIARAVEGRVLGGLHPRLPALSLPAPPGSRRVPSHTTVYFVLENSTPDSISEVSCLSEASPWGTGSIHTLSRGWDWQGVCVASVNLPQLRTLPLNLHLWGTDTPGSSPCYSCSCVLASSRPTRVSPSHLREPRGLRPPCGLQSGCSSCE